jgi:hypothetical protein
MRDLADNRCRVAKTYLFPDQYSITTTWGMEPAHDPVKEVHRGPFFTVFAGSTTRERDQKFAPF